VGKTHAAGARATAGRRADANPRASSSTWTVWPSSSWGRGTSILEFRSRGGTRHVELTMGFGETSPMASLAFPIPGFAGDRVPPSAPGTYALLATDLGLWDPSGLERHHAVDFSRFRVRRCSLRPGAGPAAHSDGHRTRAISAPCRSEAMGCVPPAPVRPANDRGALVPVAPVRAAND
jgi:hypothetical protein